MSKPSSSNIHAIRSTNIAQFKMQQMKTCATTLLRLCKIACHCVLSLSRQSKRPLQGCTERCRELPVNLLPCAGFLRRGCICECGSQDRSQQGLQLQDAPQHRQGTVQQSEYSRTQRPREALPLRLSCWHPQMANAGEELKPKYSATSR